MPLRLEPRELRLHRERIEHEIRDQGRDPAPLAPLHLHAEALGEVVAAAPFRGAERLHAPHKMRLAAARRQPRVGTGARASFHAPGDREPEAVALLEDHVGQRRREPRRLQILRRPLAGRPPHAAAAVDDDPHLQGGVFKLTLDIDAIVASRRLPVDQLQRVARLVDRVVVELGRDALATAAVRAVEHSRDELPGLEPEMLECLPAFGPQEIVQFVGRLAAAHATALSAGAGTSFTSCRTTSSERTPSATAA